MVCDSIRYILSNTHFAGMTSKRRYSYHKLENTNPETRIKNFPNSTLKTNKKNLKWILCFGVDTPCQILILLEWLAKGDIPVKKIENSHAQARIKNFQKTNKNKILKRWFAIRFDTFCQILILLEWLAKGDISDNN